MRICTDTNQQVPLGHTGWAAAVTAMRKFRGRSVAGIAARMVETLLTWQSRSAQRRHLLTLDDRLLKDVGLSREDVDAETRKPFYVR